MVMRWLGGGKYTDIMAVYGVSKFHFYAIKDQILKAIIREPSLQMHFPSNEEEYKATSIAFQSRSYNGLISGCVGCVDGWLILIQTPRKDEVFNVIKYFSGHYQAY